MRSRKWLFSILSFGLLASVSAQPPAPPPPPKEPESPPATSALRDPNFYFPDPDEKLLFRSRMRRDSASLLALLKKLSVDDADLARCDELVRKLGSEKFAEREAAAKQLVALGPAAAAALHRADQSDDAEVRRSAKRCLELIGGGPTREQILAVIRILFKRGVAESISVLLHYLPSSADSEIEEEICFGLDGVVQKSGTVPKELLAALADKHPKRRAIAACIVANRGTVEQRASAKKLLKDPDSTVRLRTAQGLLATKDASGIPTLIDLLADAPIEEAWQAEELLRYVAGPGSPKVFVGEGAVGQRKECQTAWTDALDTGKAAVELKSRSIHDRWPMLIFAVGEENKKDRSVTLAARFVEKVAWLYGGDGSIRWRRPTGQEGITEDWRPREALRLYKRGLENHFMLGWPYVKSIDSLRNSVLLTVDYERLALTDGAGRMKWFLFPRPNWIDQARVGFPLLQLGFAPPWSEDRDLAETINYRLNTLVSQREEYRTRARQWFVAQGIVALERYGVRAGDFFPDNAVDPKSGNRVVNTADLCIMLRAAADPSPKVRAKVAEQLAKWWSDEAPTVTPVLTRMTRDEDKQVRYAAIQALRVMHRASDIAADALARIVSQKSDKDLSSQAMFSVQCLGPNARVAVPALIRRLRDPEEDIGYSASMALSANSRHALIAVPELVRRCVEADFAYSAGAALTAIAQYDEEMIGKLVKAIESGNTRRAAVLALEGAADRSDQAYDALVRAVELTSRERPTSRGNEFEIACQVVARVGKWSPKLGDVFLTVALDSSCDERRRLEALSCFIHLVQDRDTVLSGLRRLADPPLAQPLNRAAPETNDRQSVVARIARELLLDIEQGR